jgi:F-type H+-transporting ATPase subunit b
LKSEAEALIAAYEKALADARAQAQATIRETTVRLEAAAAERHRELATALSERIGAAEREITAAKQRALAQINDVAVDVAGSVATRLIGVVPEAGEVSAAVGRVMAERSA